MADRYWKFIDAIKNGNLGEFEVFFKEEYLEKSNEYGWRAIHHAANEGHINIINKLIEFHCDIEATDKDGLRAIHYAAAGSHIKIINKLIDCNCDIEAVTDKYKWRAIHYAAFRGHFNIINKLIECNCDINPLTKDNQSVLNIAKNYGKDDCVRLLETSLEDRQQTEEIIEVLTKGDINAILKTLENYSFSRIMDHKTKTSLLDELLKRKDINIFEVLNKKPVTEEELNDWKKKKDEGMNLQSYELIEESLLYRCIEHEKGSGFDILSTPDIINRNSLFMGPSVLETVVEFGKIMFIKTVLSRLKAVDEEEDVARTMVYIKNIINKKGDIYKINKINQMVISFCLNKTIKAQIEKFYNRHQQRDQAPNIPAELICQVCRDKKVDCVFDCGHVFCMDCGQQVYLCPLCRAAPTNPKKMLL